MTKQPCSCCGKLKNKGQWWFLSNYFGVNGRFCSTCFEKVSHDSYGKPNHPIAHKKILEKLS